MKYSKNGYKRNSKDVNNPYNIIPSGNITMKGVDFPVMGTDNFGNQQLMMPGGEYIFPGNSVYEVPLQNFPRHFQIGGGISDMTTNLRNRDYDDRRDKPFAQDGVEFSVCDSRERLPNGTFLPGCQGGGYRESVVRPYAGFGITSGKPSDKEYTASGRVSAGVAGYLNNSPFMTHLGVNAGGRFNYENNEAKINPLFNATGSVGVQGNFKIGRKEIPVGAGVYGSQDLRNDTGLTTGFYGTLGKFAAKFGYNPTTGEKMGTIGFGLPIRQTGGSLPQYQIKGEKKSGATHADSLFLLNKVQDLYRNLDEKNFTVTEGTKKPISNQKSWEAEFPALIDKRENSILREIEFSKKNKHGELTDEYGNRILDDDLIKRGEVSDYWNNIDDKFYGTTDWLTRGGDDMEYPMTYIHQNIKPHSFQDNTKGNGENYSPSVAAYMYDPLLITPDNLLSPKQLAKKYDPNYKYNTSNN